MTAMKKEAPARDWVRKAENDLLNAHNTLLTLGQNCPYDTVCFHGQQAVEKYIKALLSHRLSGAYLKKISTRISALPGRWRKS